MATDLLRFLPVLLLIPLTYTAAAVLWTLTFTVRFDDLKGAVRRVD